MKSIKKPSSSVYGGNIVSNWDLKEGEFELASGAYNYFFIQTKTEELVRLDSSSSFTVYFLQKPFFSRVSTNGFYLNEGDVLQVENSTVSLEVRNGPIQLLIVGKSEKLTVESTVSLTRSTDLYKVTKPWGHELWLNKEHPGYILKQIFIKSGTKTSLQYHRFKKETNLLLSGTARLHYSTNFSVPMNQPLDLSSALIHPISTVDVSPFTLHRLEAVTDVLLYEASTPHLDDVIRIQDDMGRADGRILQEHIQ